MHTSIFTGSRGQYRWLERTGGYLWEVLEVAPQVVEGKHVTVTAFDSGPLTLTPEEVAQGWYRHGSIAVSPRIVTASQMSNDQFDEWYVFGTPTVFDDYEVFVNDSVFSLRSRENNSRQERFWSQLEHIRPESYLSEGDNLIWATRDSGLFEQVVGAIRTET